MTLDRIFQVIEWLVYLAFLGISTYLILEGQIYQKYAKEMTDFTKYDEPINERPTIIVCLKQLMRITEDEILKLGIDFNILSYVREIEHHNYSTTELSISNNSYLTSMEQNMNWKWKKFMKVIVTKLGKLIGEIGTEK